MSTVIIKVVKIGDVAKEVPIQGGTTVREVLTTAGYDAEKFRVAYLQSNSEVSLNTQLFENSTLVLTKKENITGGLV